MNQVCIGKTHLIDIVNPNTNIPDAMGKIISSRRDEDKEDAFFCCNLSDIIKKHQKWTNNLSRVQPYYTMKCNSDPMVLRVLADLGVKFACANKAEIKKALDLGVGADCILFSNPCKQKTHIKYATQQGVTLMTFDSIGELNKIKSTCPSARLILCTMLEDVPDEPQPNLGVGCDPTEAEDILMRAKELGLDVVGLSFCLDASTVDMSSYPQAISTAHEIQRQATQLGFKIELLNLGAGFIDSDSEELPFDEVSLGISASLQKHFPDGCGVQVIAEPGPFFVSSAFTIAVNVIAKRVVNQDRDSDNEDDLDDDLQEDKEPAFMYYVNDGVYGSFNSMLYDGATSLVPMPLDDRKGDVCYSCSIWGPTCDSLDCLTTYQLFPELEVGDWVLYENMGGYTQTASSAFNGMPQPKVHYTISEDLLPYLYLDRPRHTPQTPKPTSDQRQLTCWNESKDVHVNLIQGLNVPFHLGR